MWSSEWDSITEKPLKGGSPMSFLHSASSIGLCHSCRGFGIVLTSPSSNIDHNGNPWLINPWLINMGGSILVADDHLLVYFPIRKPYGSINHGFIWYYECQLKFKWLNIICDVTFINLIGDCSLSTVLSTAPVTYALGCEPRTEMKCLSWSMTRSLMISIACIISMCIQFPSIRK